MELAAAASFLPCRAAVVSAASMLTQLTPQLSQVLREICCAAAADEMDGTIPISDFYVAAVYNFPELSNFMVLQVDYSSCYLDFQVAPSVFNMLPPLHSGTEIRAGRSAGLPGVQLHEAEIPGDAQEAQAGGLHGQALQMDDQLSFEQLK